MIGLVLVTHGDLAEHFVGAMEHVVGPQENVASVCIGPNDDMEQKRAEIVQAVSNVDTGSGTIILTDLFGGTPSNLAMNSTKSAQLRVLYGVNMPALIKLARLRDKSLDEAVDAAVKAGHRYLNSCENRN